ncbi:glutaredoxin-1 [Protobothrops mucrosquamatus]|uniref:glutaredoxin-1 n=1 Tax=Protobothrops mucrosquamatus TaxID=103944 RepID=UPI000775E319|nr:glutaredoxin-1 [Protobothrops mucrosquamatus]
MAQQFVVSHIASDKVVVFGKKGCPFCHNALDLLKQINIKPGHLEYIDLTSQNNMDAIQDYLMQLTGARTVPRIFIGKSCIGGFTDLDALNDSGELSTMLKKIGAL